jgi:hypothetical protein
MRNRVYNVYYDGSPGDITEIGLAIYARWVSFALGQSELNGHRVQHPTGKMASAIRVIERGDNHIGIIFDERLAPEIRWLDEGHGPIDMKKYMKPGQIIPMHRGPAGQFGGAGYGPPVFQPVMPGRRRSRMLWAAPREAGRSGFARIPGENEPGGDPDAWVIPAMPAWSVISALTEMAESGDLHA